MNIGQLADNQKLREFSQKYFEILASDDFSGINLTRIATEEDFWNKQILDSVLPLEKSQKFSALVENIGRVVDVGFGGGFPILPLRFVLSEVVSGSSAQSFLGIEARDKKVLAVEKISKALDDSMSRCRICSISNNGPKLKLKHARLEDIEFDLPVVITFKAVGDIAEFLDMINISNDSITIHVFFYKGPNVEELEKIDSFKLKNLSYSLIERVEYSVGENKRTFLGYEIKNVPRGTLNNKSKNQNKKSTKSNKSLVKYSDIL